MPLLCRHPRTILCGLSLLLSAGVWILWGRAQSGTDTLSLSYDRYLEDRSAASDLIELLSDDLIWLGLCRARVEPDDGRHQWGYYFLAGESGGWPRVDCYEAPHPPVRDFMRLADQRSGCGPMRCQMLSP